MAEEEVPPIGVEFEGTDTGLVRVTVVDKSGRPIGRRVLSEQEQQEIMAHLHRAERLRSGTA